MPPTDIIRIKALVRGRVQGVGYRFFCQEAARQAGLNGWVKNEFDGDVSLEIEGPPARVKQYVERIQSAHPGAHVSSVSTENISPRFDADEDFQIIF
ncbi:MAG TPA: acylphosphatase [Elusimicrobiota bacterium]|nr:acylphosphatase [Elusimicrobiota bacterium]